MKKSNILWAVLLMMAAAIIITACSSDDSTDETSAGQGAAKTIPYTVTVGQDEAAATRATVDADLKTLKFAAGDKLYVTGANIQGVLNIQTGTGTASATFSGNLTYSGSGTPAADLELTATLVGTSNVGVQITDSKVTGMNYPTNAYCTDVNEAVQKYSNLTGTSTYGTKSFELSQQTAFLNFVVLAGEGTSVSAVVKNGETTLCTANVTTTTENSQVVAKFVLPVASGTTLSSATVKVGENDALTITNATLTGKVYNVDKMPARDLTEVTTTDVGKIVGKDGKIYNSKAAAEAVATGNAVAMIAYVGSDNGEDAPYNHGLALALSDANDGTACKWKTSNTDAGHTKQTSITFTEESGLQYNDATHNSDTYPAFKAAIANNGTAAPPNFSAWFLASGYQWQKMIGAAGFSNLGLQENALYWSSAEYSAFNAWVFDSYDGNWYNSDKGYVNPLVRACLAF